MPSNRELKTMNGVHRALLKISGGRFGWTVFKMPVLELTTTGRRSREPRSVMLTSPYSEGGNPVIVASKGGDDTHPSWFLNLQENPNVLVTTKNSVDQKMTARIALVDERARLWPIIAEQFDNYAGYQNKTNREIPLVILEPPV